MDTKVLVLNELLKLLKRKKIDINKPLKRSLLQESIIKLNKKLKRKQINDILKNDENIKKLLVDNRIKIIIKKEKNIVNHNKEKNIVNHKRDLSKKRNIIIHIIIIFAMKINYFYTKPWNF